MAHLDLDTFKLEELENVVTMLEKGLPIIQLVFIDDIDFSGIGMNGHLFDIKQIEVFKGPQSIIVGPNALAGLINFSSNDPTPFLLGHLKQVIQMII